MFSYRSLLKQAWEVSWKHKYLWFLGLFASLTAAGGSWEYQLLAQNLNRGLIDGSYYRLSGILALADLIKTFFLGIINLFSYDFATILNALSLLIISFVLIAFVIWLAITCQAALVNDVKKINNSKKKDLNLSLREGLTVGHGYFWPVLGLNLMIKIVISLAFFITGLPLLFMVLSSTPMLVTAYTVLFVIFVPVAVGLSLLLKYAIAYHVLDNKSFVSALEHGRKLFVKNWLVSLEMAIILFIINFVASLIILIILTLVLLPLLLLGLMFQISWLVVLALLLAIALIIIFGAVLTTFQTATWTNLFLRLQDKGALAKLERIFSR